MMQLNRKKIINKLKDVTVLCLLLSFIVHLVVLISIHFDKSQNKTRLAGNKKDKQVMRVVLQPKPKPKVLDNIKRKQIVATEQNGLKEKAKDAKFLSKSNQKFDRQVVAKSIGSHKRAGVGERTGRKKKSQASAQQAIKVVTAPKIKAKRNTKRDVKKKRVTLADLAVGQMQNVKKKKRQKQIDSIAKGLKNGAKGQVGLAQNNDHVEDIPLGDMTNLNTVEFRYYGFYHRIKQQLEQYWGRTIQEKVKALYKSGRKIASVDQRITSLVITLDDNGQIKDIALKSTSGMKALDDAAIESFSRAGPFPNPPKGMIKDGLATIEWGFVVKS
jgi:TonB family protein